MRTIATPTPPTWLAMLVLAAAMLLGAAGARAQTVSTTCPYNGGCRTISFTATLQVDSVRQIEYTNADPLPLPAPVVANVENGFLASVSATSLRARANFPFKVMASRAPSANTFMQATGALASTTKPSSHVRPKIGSSVTSSADGFPLGQTETELFREAKGLVRWNAPTVIFYGLQLSWSDSPGTYRQGISFRIASQP